MLVSSIVLSVHGLGRSSLVHVSAVHVVLNLSAKQLVQLVSTLVLSVSTSEKLLRSSALLLCLLASSGHQGAASLAQVKSQRSPSSSGGHGLC